MGETVVANGDLRRTLVRYADQPLTVGGVDDYESDEAGLSLDNYRKGVGISWATRHAYQTVDYNVPLAASYQYQHDFPHGATELSYNETPTTSLTDRFSVGGPSSLHDPDDYLVRAGSAERYVSKRLAWSLALEWERYDFAVALYDESRDDRTGVNGLPLADEQQSRASVQAHGAEREGAAKDAWIDGTLETVYALNRHSSAFAIDTEVDGGSLRGEARSIYGRSQPRAPG